MGLFSKSAGYADVNDDVEYLIKSALRISFPPMMLFNFCSPRFISFFELGFSRGILISLFNN